MATQRRSKFGPAPLDRTEKPCSVCKEVKPLEQFGADSKRADGRKRQCKLCLAAAMREWQRTHRDSVRRTRIKKKYGLTPEAYEALLTKQGPHCPICGKALPHHLSSPDSDLRDAVAIDHNHTTGAIRGILCAPCNKGLGYFVDDPQRLMAAARYLQS